MARSRIKHTAPPTLRPTLHTEEVEIIERVARRYNIDVTQALRVIIHQHAAWEPYIQPVGVPPEISEEAVNTAA